MTLTILQDIRNKAARIAKRDEELRIERLLESDKTKRYTEIRREMVVSHAFLNLGKNSMALLMMFLLKRRMKPRKGKAPLWLNANEIHLTWKEFQNPPFGWSSTTFGRAKSQLLEYGFIKVVYQGGSCEKDRSVYGASEQWRMWKRGVDFSPKRKDAKRGFQGKNNENLIHSQHNKMIATHTQQNDSHPPEKSASECQPPIVAEYDLRN